MRTGFIVGKFYPPHRGHKYLIEFARAQVDRLIVMLAHHPSQDYGPQYATLMGSEHVMVDRNRLQIPVSATQIRTKPLEHLEMLEPCVRACNVLRVVLIGAESTGKTTLAKILSSHFDTHWVAEYGREHWEKKLAGVTLADAAPSWSEDEFLHIAQEQQRREDHAARVANRVLICDTNAFATGTWYERYMQCRNPTVDALGDASKCDLYLLTAPDVPFVQDGFRDGEDIRGWMHQRFLDQLEQKKLPFQIIGGDYEVRINSAISAVDQLLASSDDQR